MSLYPFGNPLEVAFVLGAPQAGTLFGFAKTDVDRPDSLGCNLSSLSENSSLRDGAVLFLP